MGANSWLTVRRQKRHIDRNTGQPHYTPCITIACKGGQHSYCLTVYDYPITEREYNKEEVKAIIMTLLLTSKYVICPGIKEYPSELKFETKQYGKWELPYKRHDSKCCAMWHDPTKQHHFEHDSLFNVCNSCCKLQKDIQKLLKSNDQRKSSYSPSSNYAWCRLSL